ADYQVALAKLGPRCDLCHAGLLESHMLLGSRSQAAARVDTAMHEMSGGVATPLTYMSFLHPRWGGNWLELERFVNRFAEDFPDARGVRVWRGALLGYRADAWLAAGQVRQARLLLGEALRVDPDSGHLWERLTAVALVAEDAEPVLQASERALAVNPQAVGAL